MAIEFALVFSLLFGIFYAIISYALPLLMMQAFHAAAAEGTRAAISVVLTDSETPPCPASYQARVTTTARTEAEQRIAWLQPLMTGAGDQPVAANITSDCVLTVRIAYDNYPDNPPIPMLTLPVIGDIPRLPDTLAGTATVRL